MLPARLRHAGLIARSDDRGDAVRLGVVLGEASELIEGWRTA
jgi:hypothetical protein